MRFFSNATYILNVPSSTHLLTDFKSTCTKSASGTSQKNIGPFVKPKIQSVGRSVHISSDWMSWVSWVEWVEWVSWLIEWVSWLSDAIPFAFASNSSSLHSTLSNMASRSSSLSLEEWKTTASLFGSASTAEFPAMIRQQWLFSVLRQFLQTLRLHSCGSNPVHCDSSNDAAPRLSSMTTKTKISKWKCVRMQQVQRKLHNI